MRRPSFQFYPADWLANTNLKRCTHAERGVWIDVMCLMHDSEEYGVLRWSLEDLAQAVGCHVDLLVSLWRKGVLKGKATMPPIGSPIGDGIDSGLPLIYTPRTGGKKGDPVVVLENTDGDIWFSSRMVIDEHVRLKRGEHGEKSQESANGSKRNTNFDGETMPPIGALNGDGIGAPPSSSSSPSSKHLSAPSGALVVSTPTTDQTPACSADAIVSLYHDLMPLNPRCKVLSTARKRTIRARWKEAALLSCEPFGYSSRDAGLAAWRKFFEVCAESFFLTGRAAAPPGRVPFVADIDFLMSPSGFAKCLENKYHREATA